MNETGTAPLTAYDPWGGYNGTYGSAVSKGGSIYGPSASYHTWPYNAGAGYTAAFEYPNYAAGLSASTSAVVVLPALNLNTNALTLIAWLKPNSKATMTNGTLMSCRSATTVMDFGYTGGTNSAGYPTLGYNWGGDPVTQRVELGFGAESGQWESGGAGGNAEQRDDLPGDGGAQRRGGDGQRGDAGASQRGAGL